MSVQNATLGLNSKLYINTGTVTTPIYDECTLVMDLSLNEEKGDADVTTRGAAGWRQREPTLKDAQLDATLLDDPADTTYVVIQAAYDNNSLLEVLVMNGPNDVPGSNGLQIAMKVSRWVLTQPLEEGNQRELSMIPARGSFAPARIVSPFPGP